VSREIIEPLPVSELFLEIDIILVGEELVELFLVGAVRPLDLAVELG
jgi:hypothetical protein